MSFYPFFATPPLQLQATTGLAGFALQNATPTILTWTAPDDGQTHRVSIIGVLSVSSALTGGELAAAMTDPSGTTAPYQVMPAGQAVGSHSVGLTQAVPGAFLIKAGSTFSLEQFSAVTAGAATLYAEIWAS